MNRRSFLGLGAAAGAAAVTGPTTLLDRSPEIAGVGIDMDQYPALPKSHKALLHEWVIANGVRLDECCGVRLTPDGAAHFQMYSANSRGKFNLVDGEIARFWHCVPKPTAPPAIAWLPWEGEPS